MSAQQSIPASESNDSVFQKLDVYPWESDEEFQSGLQTILSGSTEGQDREALTLQARCFYFSRKFGVSVDPAAYQEWRKAQPRDADKNDAGAAGSQSKSEETTEGTTSEKPPYPLSFNRLVELITEGKEVPGIKDIPDTLLEGQASESTSTQRKKPWEK